MRLLTGGYKESQYGNLIKPVEDLTACELICQVGNPLRSSHRSTVPGNERYFGMDTLLEYFENNPGRLIHKWIHYFEVYERHLAKFRNMPVNLLEIGVFQGGSLQMWKWYFGEQSRITGFDVDPRCVAFEEDRVDVVLGDQSNREDLARLVSGYGPFDVIIDDGGHRMDQQVISFEVLFEGLTGNGVYICEDLHTSYWTDYGGGYRHLDTFVEFAKGKVDALNAWHSKDSESFVIDAVTRTTQSIHFYDSVAVFEKRPMVPPTVKMTGEPAPGF